MGLITWRVTTGGASIDAFGSGVGQAVDITLGRTNLLLCLGTAIIEKSLKIFTVK